MKLTPFLVRCQFCFRLNAFIIVEVDAFLKEAAILLSCGGAVAQPLGFEYAEKIGTGVVKRHCGGISKLCGKIVLA